MRGWQSLEPRLVLTTYFVNVANDIDFGDNQYTTAAGNAAADGLTAATPVDSLATLLGKGIAFQPGDQVFIDTGAYKADHDLVFTAAHTGLTLQGPTDVGKVATLQRTGVSSFQDAVLKIDGADNLTISHVVVTGGGIGVLLSGDTIGDGITLMHNQLHGNGYGIYGATTEGITDLEIRQNEIFDNDAGIALFAQLTSSVLISGNTVSGHLSDVYPGDGIGVSLELDGAEVTGNQFTNNRIGITASASLGATQIVVSANQVSDNQVGIQAFGGTQVIGNEIYGHRSPQAGGMGIQTAEGPTVEDNSIYDNDIGIQNYPGFEPTRYTINSNSIFANGTGIAGSDFGDIVLNRIYGNEAGVRFTHYASVTSGGSVNNNLIYDNEVVGIDLRDATDFTKVSFNTFYEPVADAVWMSDILSPNGIVQSNLISIGSGTGILFETTSEDLSADPSSWKFQQSEGNLFHVFNGGSVGTWNAIAYVTLAAWQVETGLDTASFEGDPLYRDVDGADDLLGYDQDLSVDGGLDDDFGLMAGSPAIDKGYGTAPAMDFNGINRFDEPEVGNDVWGGFAEQVLGESGISAGGGIAQNWNADDQAWTLVLPFSFDLAGIDYGEVQVSSNGLLHFAGQSDPASGQNDPAALTTNVRIAALWDDLSTAGVGDDIYIDVSTTDQVTIRWDATLVATGGDVQFQVTLTATGEIRIDFGTGNSQLSPTIGIGYGTGSSLLSIYDGADELSEVNSVSLVPFNSFADVGAIEFPGSFSDSYLSIFLNSTAASGNVGDARNAGSQPSIPTLHEWQDVVAELWMEVGELLPDQPLDLTAEIQSFTDWFTDPVVVDHMGSSPTISTVVNGSLTTSTVNVFDLDLSGYAQGQQVLIAKVKFSPDVQDLVGLPMASLTEYPHSAPDNGFQLLSSAINASQDLGVVSEIEGAFIPVVYDANDDGKIGIQDFAEFISVYGRIPDSQNTKAYRFDYDQSGKVGLSDFSLLIRNYGRRKSTVNVDIIQPPIDFGAQTAPLQLLLEGEPVQREADAEFWYSLAPEPVGTNSLDDVLGRNPGAEKQNVEPTVQTGSHITSEESTHYQLDVRLIDAAFSAEYESLTPTSQEESAYEMLLLDWLL
ncbi:hypothetical protein C5Y96_02970 [Blastopirellula marina]|uniref:Probable pectate lyase C n=1 Tax=Blastopirellula marina TaxID=124 RepID=A0A2S8G334_9BACT|nr:hypothetical protein C5Y96_02970 [Blastopirellula marina]RCS55156.1 hypothetical protein DTL36_02975 [Bremerella cremea]